MQLRTLKHAVNKRGAKTRRRNKQLIKGISFGKNGRQNFGVSWHATHLISLTYASPARRPKKKMMSYDVISLNGLN